MISDIYQIWPQAEIGYARTVSAEANAILDATPEGIRPEPGCRLDITLPNRGRGDPGVEADVLYLSRDTLLLAEDAIETLEPMLSEAGYFIDVNLELKRQYRLFVCDHRVDALDPLRSVADLFDSGNIRNIYRYEFLPDRLPDTAIFMLDRPRAGLFATNRFFTTVNAHKMIGITFKHVWNHHTGGIHDSHEPNYETYPGETADKEKIARRAARAALAARGPLRPMTPKA